MGNKVIQAATAMKKVADSFDGWLKILINPSLADTKSLSDARCAFMAAVKELEAVLLS